MSYLLPSERGGASGGDTAAGYFGWHVWPEGEGVAGALSVQVSALEGAVARLREEVDWEGAGRGGEEACGLVMAELRYACQKSPVKSPVTLK